MKCLASRTSTLPPRPWQITAGRGWPSPCAIGASTRSWYASGSPLTSTPPVKTLWTEGLALRVAFITVGETGRKTGGYLYNARVIAGLRGRGMEVEEVVACGASPGEQRAAAWHFGSAFDPSMFDGVVVDALARIVVAPHLDLWRTIRPVVALVHELPGVAGGEPEHEWEYEEPLLRSDRLVAVSG